MRAIVRTEYPACPSRADHALILVHVQALNLPGAARRTGGVRWEHAWHTQVKRVHPASAWGTGHGALPQKPDPCPHKLLTYKDWDGAGTNNVIQALVNALWVSRVSNRTLLLSAAASDMMKALFDTGRLAFVLIVCSDPVSSNRLRSESFATRSLHGHFCILTPDDSQIEEGREGKVVAGKGGNHAGAPALSCCPICKHAWCWALQRRFFDWLRWLFHWFYSLGQDKTCSAFCRRPA